MQILPIPRIPHWHTGNTSDLSICSSHFIQHIQLIQLILSNHIASKYFLKNCEANLSQHNFRLQIGQPLKEVYLITNFQIVATNVLQIFAKMLGRKKFGNIFFSRPRTLETYHNQMSSKAFPMFFRTPKIPSSLLSVWIWKLRKILLESDTLRS